MELLFYLFIFLLGGVLYQGLELLWRSRTHWSMFLAGGTCAVLLDFLCNGVFFALPLFLKCLLGAAVITGVEFAFGWVVNLKLGWGVWDYSDRRGNVLGQICPIYSAYWCVLSLPALLLLDFLHRVML